MAILVTEVSQLLMLSLQVSNAISKTLQRSFFPEYILSHSDLKERLEAASEM